MTHGRACGFTPFPANCNRTRHSTPTSSLSGVMDHVLRSQSIARTVTVVVTHALDLDHAVDVLVAEFGFDATFTALADIADDTRVHRAMWIALSTASVERDLGIQR